MLLFYDVLPYFILFQLYLIRHKAYTNVVSSNLLLLLIVKTIKQNQDLVQRVGDAFRLFELIFLTGFNYYIVFQQTNQICLQKAVKLKTQDTHRVNRLKKFIQ